MVLLNALSGWQWALALAVPVGIVLLYFLRLRRRPLEVPSTFLWKKSIEDLRVNSLWQRLRRNILLLLQLLVVAAILFALLRPAWNVTTTGERIVLLIDHSASMSATDVKPTRLADAKRRALELVEQMEGGDAAMVIAFADSARVAASYTSEKASLRQAIDAIEPTDRPTNIREALLVASAMLHPAEEKAGAQEKAAAGSPMAATLYLLSDGRFPEVEDIPLSGMDIRFLRIGTSSQNVGIMSLAPVPRPKDLEQLDIVARIRNFGSEPTKVSAELRIDGNRVDLRGVDLPGNGSSVATFPYAGPPAARLSLHLSPADDFPVDDVAYSVIAPPEPARILHIGPANAPLTAALNTPSIQSIAKIESLPITDVDRDLTPKSDGDRYDLVIFDRCLPKVMPPANTWMIGTVPGEMTTAIKEVKGPVILTWDSLHPLLQFLNLDDVSLFETKLVEPSDRWKSLIETDKGLVLATIERGPYTDLVQTVPFVDDKGNWQTDWPLKPSFPLFVMNVIRHLGGIDWQQGVAIRTGDPILFQPRKRVDKVEVLLPDGRSQSLRPSDDGSIEFLETGKAGFYQFKAGDESRVVAVDLFDDKESTIAPVDKVRFGTDQSTDVSRDYQSRQELWKWLALAGLGFLVLEWYIYNRRVYV